MVKDAALDLFHPAVRRWFKESFNAPTPPQILGWPPIARGENTLILAQGAKQRSIRLHKWDSLPAGEPPARSNLEEIGFMREDLKMIYYRKYVRQEST